MPSNRKAIRDKIVEDLEAAFGGSADIDNARHRAIKAEDYIEKAFVNVHTPGDTSELSPDDADNIRLETVEIMVYVTGKEDHEDPAAGEQTIIDKLETAAAVVEGTVGTFRNALGGACQKIWYVATVIDVSKQSERSEFLLGTARMQYTARVIDQIGP